MMTVTCLTSGCENEGIALQVPSTTTDPDGTIRPVAIVQCGPCQQWIIPPPTEGGTP